MIDLYEPYLEELNLNITKDTTMYQKRIKLIELKYKREIAEENIDYLNSIINGLERELEIKNNKQITNEENEDGRN